MGTRMETGSAQEELQAAQLCSLSHPQEGERIEVVAPRRSGSGGKHPAGFQSSRTCTRLGTARCLQQPPQGPETELPGPTERDRLWGHSSQG